jgi:hypothetical protein
VGRDLDSSRIPEGIVVLFDVRVTRVSDAGKLFDVPYWEPDAFEKSE